MPPRPRWISSAPPIALLLLTLACSSSDAGSSDCDRCGDAGQSDAGQSDATAAAFCDALGNYPSQWIQGGPDCGTEAAIQVHQLNEDTFILRQSLCTSDEAPFLYLLLGDDKALLEDTGDGGIDIVSTVNAIVEAREAAVGHSIELVVVNSHGHGDHVGANQAFGQDGATVVGTSKNSLQTFFNMGWPHELASFDLGNRIVDIAGIPGHQSAHISIYDRKYGLLLTGDTVYPGRLFINDFAAYKASISFLVDFTTTRELCAVLGTHIEMSTTPGDDYDFGATYHPNEKELALTRATLLELAAAIDGMGATPVQETHDDFIVFPL